MTASGGIRFGNYTLFRRLARGGMAEVFLARQVGLEGFDRRVAVKRILPHLADSREFTEMFLREARLAARLSHPNIVHIYDFGKVGTDYFIAMEYVEGVTAGELIARCAKEPMPPVLIARIGADAAAALHYAHELKSDAGKQLGLVHRDVSPANVMVSYDGVIKVVDFGIAKAAELHDDKTNPGTVKGKYAYMSPEQTVAARLDGRSDVFSLSIVMWELVAARPIVERGDRVAAMRAIRDGRLPRLEQVAPQTPRALVEAINWGLSRRREERPDAAQLGQELEAFIKASPELATSMHLSSWLRPRFAPSVEVAESSQPEGTSAGHTGAEGPSTQASYSEEDLAATIPVQRMSVAEIFGNRHGANPSYYPAGSAPPSMPNPVGNTGMLPRPVAQTSQPTQQGHAPAPQQQGAPRPAPAPSGHPGQPARPATQAGQAAGPRGAQRATAAEPPTASMRSAGRAAPPPMLLAEDTEAVAALPPPRRGQLPHPAPMATPQRTFSELDDDAAGRTRRRLLVAAVAVALIVSAFLFTLFVVQPFLAGDAPPPPLPRPDATVTPISSTQELPPGQVRLSVQTTPPSEVLFDGSSLGASPVKNAAVPAGFHTLTFQRPGHAPITRGVTLKPDVAADLSFNLE